MMNHTVIGNSGSELSAVVSLENRSRPLSRNHRRPVHQKLRPGDDDLVAGLDAILHFVVCCRPSDRSSVDSAGPMESAILRFGDEGKVLSAQSRDR